MNYPDESPTFSREAMTRVLSTLCKKLDKNNTIAYNWNNSISDFVVDKVWVVGSYARGAKTCGDVDVVISIKNLEGNTSLGYRAVNALKSLIGRIKHLDYCGGDPVFNTHNIWFEDAVVIWDLTSSWKERLAGLRTKPSAGRAPRHSDVVHVQSYRLQEVENQQTYLKVKTALNSQILEETWTPLSQCPRASYEELEQYAPRTFDLKRWAAVRIETLKIGLGHLLRMCSELGVSPERAKGDRGWLEMHGMRVYLSPGELPTLTDLQEGCQQYFSLAIIPVLSKDGPNGLWHLLPGTNHPLRKTFKTTKCWSITDKNTIEFTQSYGPTVEGMVAELSMSPTCDTDDLEHIALAYIEAAELDGTPPPGYTVSAITDLQLFALTFSCDAITLKGQYLPLTKTGVLLGQETNEDLIALSGSNAQMLQQLLLER